MSELSNITTKFHLKWTLVCLRKYVSFATL